MAMREEAKQVLGVAALLTTLAALVCSAMLGWRYLPEVWADWIGTIVGVISTPFFMEASFFLIGLAIVVLINHHRQKKAGDEMVEIDVEVVPGTGSGEKSNR